MQHARTWCLFAVAIAVIALLVWRLDRLTNRIDELASAVNRHPAERGLPAGSPAFPPTCFASSAFAKQVAAEVVAASSRESTVRPASDQDSHPAADPVVMATLANANQLVDQAIEDRRLGRARVAELRTMLATVPAAQADEIRRRIAAAVNRNEMIPEDHHLILP